MALEEVLRRGETKITHCPSCAGMLGFNSWRRLFRCTRCGRHWDIKFKGKD